MTARWEHCIFHPEDTTAQFMNAYFGGGRRLLLIAAAGFDPRSSIVAQRLAATGVPRRAIFIKEERANPEEALMKSASGNESALREGFPNNTVLTIDVFDREDGAVVGGRQLVSEVLKVLGDFTDIAVDMSALSIGMSFPLVRALVQMADAADVPCNIHLFVMSDPLLDERIASEHADHAIYVPGFGGKAALSDSADAAKLWVPQLVSGKKEALRRIFDFLEGPETCPVLPFPSKDPRRGDLLIEEFMTELASTWEVDPRNYIYSAEEEPLDLYRTLLRLADARDRVYAAHGGSLVVLSPIGSKCAAIGALMAAMERDFPVVYLETLRYIANAESLAARYSKDAYPMHLWLTGDPYR
jgi:hypothetical protein